jgi:hypothetical protein
MGGNYGCAEKALCVFSNPGKVAWQQKTESLFHVGNINVEKLLAVFRRRS